MSLQESGSLTKIKRTDRLSHIISETRSLSVNKLQTIFLPHGKEITTSGFKQFLTGNHQRESLGKHSLLKQLGLLKAGKGHDHAIDVTSFPSNQTIADKAEIAFFVFSVFPAADPVICLTQLNPTINQSHKFLRKRGA